MIGRASKIPTRLIVLGGGGWMKQIFLQMKFFNYHVACFQISLFYAFDILSMSSFGTL